MTLRLGVGALFGSVKDERTGDFVDSKGGPYAVRQTKSASATYVFVAPEVRIGRRFGQHFEINVGVELLVLAALSSPEWPRDTINAGVDGAGVFGSAGKSLMGGLVMLASPGLGARYAF